MASKQIPLSCPGHTRPVVDLAFSSLTPQGFFLISASKDGKPMLRRGDTGDWIGTFEGHKGAVWASTLNSEATQAATAAADFSAKLWDAVQGVEITSFAHKHIVKSVDFSTADDKLLTGSNEKKMRIFDLNKETEDPQIIENVGSGPKVCRWLKDDQMVVSGSDEPAVRLWDVRTLSEVKKIELSSALTGMQLSQDKFTLIVTNGNKASFYDPITLDLKKSYETKTDLNSCSLAPDESVFVCGGQDFIVYKHDYSTGMLMEYYHGHFGPVHCIKFSPDGELYATGSEDGTLRLWQTEVGKTYGLWKAQEDEKPGVTTSGNSTPQKGGNKVAEQNNVSENHTEISAGGT